MPALAAAVAARGTLPAVVTGGVAAACLNCLILSAAFAASCLPHSSSLVSSFAGGTGADSDSVVRPDSAAAAAGSESWNEAESFAAAAVEARRLEWGRVTVPAGVAVLARRAMARGDERGERVERVSYGSERSSRRHELLGNQRGGGLELARGRGQSSSRLDCACHSASLPRCVVVESERQAATRLHRLAHSHSHSPP